MKYLGVFWDEFLSLEKHVTVKCGIAMSNLMRIKYIRKYLDQTSVETVVCGLVLSHLDYSNAILTGVNNKTLRKVTIGAKLCCENYSKTFKIREHRKGSQGSSGYQ